MGADFMYKFATIIQILTAFLDTHLPTSAVPCSWAAVFS